MAEDGAMLRYVADATLGDPKRAPPAYALTCQPDLAAAGRRKAQDRFKRRRLARAITAQQRGNRSLFHLQRHAAQDVILADIRLDLANFEQWSHTSLVCDPVRDRRMCARTSRHYERLDPHARITRHRMKTVATGR